jgi:nucleotide-binding universal stress UspA family protein
MPFLVAAESVHLVVVADERIQKLMGEDPGLDISKHLARHGVHVELEQLSGKAGAVLLDRCDDVDADLLVIGAHSSNPNKLSEIIFGTVTKYVLNHVNRPILL